MDNPEELLVLFLIILMLFMHGLVKDIVADNKIFKKEIKDLKKEVADLKDE